MSEREGRFGESYFKNGTDLQRNIRSLWKTGKYQYTTWNHQKFTHWLKNFMGQKIWQMKHLSYWNALWAINSFTSECYNKPISRIYGGSQQSKRIPFSTFAYKKWPLCEKLWPLEIGNVDMHFKGSKSWIRSWAGEDFFSDGVLRKFSFSVKNWRL